MSPEDDLGFAGSDDVPMLADLHSQAFDRPWDAPTIGNLLAQHGVFGVRHPDGFILCRVIVDEAEILTLAVRPTGRRAGLGTRLVEAAASLAARNGAHRLFLEVGDDNAAAQALYRRNGFVAAGRRRAYYARVDGAAVDALILSLNLAGRLPTD